MSTSLATAKEFVKEGAYVFITLRRDPELATGAQGDVSNLRDLDRLFADQVGGAKFAPLARSPRSTLTRDI